MTDDVKSVSRRSFLRTGALGGGVVAAGGLAAPAVLAQSPLVIKMQTSWPASDIFTDMARQYVERVQAMSGGRLQVDLLDAGAVVGAFQVLDGVNDGVLDAAHTVPVYCYGKHKGASLFGTGPVFGGSAATMLAWFYQGGGQEFYRELTQDIMGLNTVGFFAFPMPAQPFGWFKEPITGVADIQGFKYRTVGLAADLMQQMGMSVAQLPGGEIVPAMERGVIDAYEFNNPTSDLRFGSPDVAKNYYLSLLPPGQRAASSSCSTRTSSRISSRTCRRSCSTASRRPRRQTTRWRSTSTRRTCRCCRTTTASPCTARRRTSWRRSSQPGTSLIPTLEEDEFIKRVLDSQRAWVERVTFYELMNAADLTLAYNHYFPGKLAI